MKKAAFTPLHPESPLFQNGDEGKIKIKLSGKPCPVTKRLCNGTSPLGRGVTGFTLVELLIVSSIISLLALGLYSAFQSGIFSYQKMGSAFKTYQVARIILNRMNLDLKNAFSYTKDDSGFKGDALSLTFFSLIETYKEAKPQKNVCHIEYNAQSLDLTSVSFQYAFATGEADHPYDWQDTWPDENNPEQKKNLPLAVRIKLVLQEEGRGGVVPIEFEKIVSLPLAD